MQMTVILVILAVIIGFVVRDVVSGVRAADVKGLKEGQRELGKSLVTFGLGSMIGGTWYVQYAKLGIDTVAVAFAAILLVILVGLAMYLRGIAEE